MWARKLVGVLLLAGVAELAKDGIKWSAAEPEDTRRCGFTYYFLDAANHFSFSFYCRRWTQLPVASSANQTLWLTFNKSQTDSKPRLEMKESTMLSNTSQCSSRLRKMTVSPLMAVLQDCLCWLRCSYYKHCLWFVLHHLHESWVGHSTLYESLDFTLRTWSNAFAAVVKHRGDT